jgi:hypothetical protein
VNGQQLLNERGPALGAAARDGDVPVLGSERFVIARLMLLVAPVTRGVSAGRRADVCSFGRLPR